MCCIRIELAQHVSANIRIHNQNDKGITLLVFLGIVCYPSIINGLNLK
jgi:hypothetical protein